VNHRDPKLTALMFNECINRGDLAGLTSLMTPDHTLVVHGQIDANTSRQASTAWSEFFRRYPDYRNRFDRVELRDDLVIMIGRSECPNEPALRGPAIWTARIADDLVAEWQVMADSSESRTMLGID
jgi:hypothetical protein